MQSIVIMIVFQIIVSLPFILGDTPVADYIEMSKFTGAGRNGRGIYNPAYDYMGSDHAQTIFWSFVPIDLYLDKERFGDRLKMGILLINIWHFFVKQNALWQCLTNLLYTFNSEHRSKLGIRTQE